MAEDPDGLESAVRILSRLLLAEETLEATLTRVAGLACRTLPGCEMASLTMMRDGRPSTAVQTDPQACELDAVQYTNDDGPCLEAYRTGKVVRLDLAADTRWPHFAAAATAAGVLGVLAVPLIVTDQALGALNLYSATASGFSEADEETALLYSEQAAVACANSEVYWRTYSLTEHLREALESRDVIGQAKGILMARRCCTSDEAFEAIRQVSQRRNVKVREIAEGVVYRGELDDDPLA
jgi:GAF domain-containing protein